MQFTYAAMLKKTCDITRMTQLVGMRVHLVSAISVCAPLLGRITKAWDVNEADINGDILIEFTVTKEATKRIRRDPLFAKLELFNGDGPLVLVLDKTENAIGEVKTREEMYGSRPPFCLVETCDSTFDLPM